MEAVASRRVGLLVCTYLCITFIIHFPNVSQIIISECRIGFIRGSKCTHTHVHTHMEIWKVKDSRLILKDIQLAAFFTYTHGAHVRIALKHTQTLRSNAHTLMSKHLSAHTHTWPGGHSSCRADRRVGPSSAFAEMNIYLSIEHYCTVTKSKNNLVFRSIWYQYWYGIWEKLTWMPLRHKNQCVCVCVCEDVYSDMWV
jgi:hypothetical protein